nr:ABC transporter B family member 11 [Ipomoea batatas]
MVSKFKSNKTSTRKPACIHEDTWRIWEAYWDRPDVIAKSEQHRKNRMNEVAGPDTGCSRHIGGSRSAIEHYHKLRDELQKEPNMFECFEHMHKKKNGAFVDERSKKIAEEIQARHDAATREVEGSTEPPVINMSQLYVDVVDTMKEMLDTMRVEMEAQMEAKLQAERTQMQAKLQAERTQMETQMQAQIASLMDELRRNDVIPTTSTPQPPTTEGHSVNSNDEDLGDD